MSRIWFIADTHFNHKNIIDYCSRPFADVAEMNETIITNWNSVVQPRDCVWMLGDFCLGSAAVMRSLVERLNGHKNLIIGNHDNLRVNDYRDYFKTVSPLPVIWNEFFVLSHSPIFIPENSPYVNIFGHVHNNPNFKSVSPNGFCASVERINYTPIEFCEIMKLIRKEKKESKNVG